MPDFGPSPGPLGGIDLCAFEASPDVVFALTSDLRLAYVNPGWGAFAQANDGADVLERWPLGAEFLTGISEPRLRSCLERRFKEVQPSQPLRTDFSCDSPARMRRFHSHVQRLPSTGHLLVVNTLLEDVPAPAGDLLSDQEVEARCLNAVGVFIQCAECRRTASSDRDRWLWVPSLLRREAARVSHGLCPVCLAVYEDD